MHIDEETFQVLVSVADPSPMELQPVLARKSMPVAPKAGPTFKPPRVASKNAAVKPKSPQKTKPQSRKPRTKVLTEEEEEGY